MTVRPKSADQGNIHERAPGAQTSLNRLRMRQEALRQQSAQLQARAEHLERVHSVSSQRLSRRIDVHEKIVLGARVKKAGLDFTRPRGEQRTDDETASMPKRLDDLSADYDRELIPGALLWLASVMREADKKVLTGMTLQELRGDGRQVLGSTRRPI